MPPPSAANRPARNWPYLLSAALVFVPAALLYLPAIYYSLTTPLAPGGDDAEWWRIHIVTSWSRLGDWLFENFLSFDAARSRHNVLYDIYTALAWRVFGPVSWLHHLTQQAVHFGGVIMFAAAFIRFTPPHPLPLYRFLPLALFLYLWLFFPNVPSARIATTEPWTVLFMGLCVWMLARQLTENAATRRRSRLITYGLFCLGYLGLALSKETNLAALLWLLLAWYGLIGWQALRRRPANGGPAAAAAAGSLRWPLLGGLPLILIFLHTFVNVYLVAGQAEYGTAPLTPQLLGGNFLWLLGELFQWETSRIITAGLILLTAALLAGVARKAWRQEWRDELFFVLLLLGLFGSMFLMLGTSFLPALRYWYPLLPLFAILLAFGAKFGLEWAGKAGGLAGRVSRPAVVALLAGFILFFVAGNYYNFLYQTIAQNFLRHAETQLTTEITRRHDAGQDIRLAADEIIPMVYVREYYDSFLPYFYGIRYSIGTEPAPETAAGETYYIVNYDDVRSGDNPPPGYRLLTYARQLATAAQGKPPYWELDAGVGISLRWQIYANDLSALWADGRHLYRDFAELGEPLIRSDYNIYRSGDYLIYRKDNCGDGEENRPLFAHLIPPADAAEISRGYGAAPFYNYDEVLERSRFRSGKLCLALLPLPNLPIGRVATGQSDREGEDWVNIWKAETRPYWRFAGTEVDAPLVPDDFRKAGPPLGDFLAQLAARQEPIIRSHYDIYHIDNLLIYAKEPCRPEDTAARFLLHLYPADPDSLPPGLGGFDNRDFDFAQYGTRADGVCLVTVPLPEFTIGLHTGQFVMEGDSFRNLWEEVWFAAGPP